MILRFALSVSAVGAGGESAKGQKLRRGDVGIAPYKQCCNIMLTILCNSALFDNTVEELYGTADDLKADMLVIAVDAAPFFLGKVHGGEAVDTVTDAPIVAGVRALYHEIGRDDAALPGPGGG